MSAWYAMPWTYHAATTVLVDDPETLTGRRVIAECESEEVARLVACAPDLLEALELVATALGDDYELYREQKFAIDNARAVIGRAVGSAT